MEDKNKKDILRNLTEDELVERQEQNLDVVIPPMSDKQFEAGREHFRKLREEEKEEEKFSILRRTEESKKLFALKEKLRSHYRDIVNELEYLPLSAAINDWLLEFEHSTRLKYAEYMTDMIKRKIIHEYFADGKIFTVGGFRHMRHEQALEYIKSVQDWTEGSRQARAACYISFTSYLHWISDRWFRRAVPSKMDEGKTFYRLSSKTITQALSLEDWHHFLDVLDANNQRDSLIARCMLYGGHRVSEILNIKVAQLDLEKNIIRFARGKNKKLELPVVYPAPFIDELRAYIQATEKQREDSDFVFITRKGKSLTRSRLNYSFAHASAQADIEKVTPEILRATWIRFNKEDVVDEKILQVKRYNFKPGSKGNQE
ncbi:MAG: site-specific integrase [Candidatus Dependentiae bacterium]|nr:site-specific integrase [Candidatus Dependentiae bacterium]